jgi:hypothetical protein
MEVHTTPAPDGTGWVIRLDGQIVATYRTRAAAVVKGRWLARSVHGQHVLHRDDGTIDSRSIYGPDQPRTTESLARSRQRCGLD